MAYGPPLCDYCYTSIPLGKPVFPCISCDDMNYCNTSCQFQDSEKHMQICSENRPTIGSTLTGLEELRGVIDAFVTPRHHVLAPTALRAILRPPRTKAEERTLDTHYFQLELIPAQDSVRLFSASVQPLTKLYAQSHNGDQQRAALIQYAQRYREQYEAAGADIAGTLFIQSRCPSVLGQSNDVTPVTIVRWLVDQVKAQPSLEPGWEESFVARMNEKT